LGSIQKGQGDGPAASPTGQGRFRGWPGDVNLAAFIFGGLKMADQTYQAYNFRKRLTAGFRALRRRGYAAKQNWWCCQTCGQAAFPDKVTRYAFYHAQDAAGLRAAEKNLLKGKDVKLGVYLAWSGDGHEIEKALTEAGLAVVWDGSETTRIWVEPRVVN